jgi:hypothetical protein
MNVDEERLIERSLRRPEALSEEERRRAARLIADDPAAKAYAEFLEEFYTLLNSEDDRDRSDRVEDFVDALFEDAPEPVVSLSPLRADSDAPSTVLAAATQDSSDDRRFSVLTTLAAKGDDLLVRVIGDHDTGQGRVYVLADSPSKQAHVIVSFPDFGLDLVTDEDGRQTFELPTESDSDRWSDANAVVRRPVAIQRVEHGSTISLEGGSGAHVQCRYVEETLSVTVQEESNSSSPSLMTAEPVGTGARTLLRLLQHEPVRHSVDADDDLLLRFYE